MPGGLLPPGLALSVLLARQSLKDIHPAASMKPTETRMAEVPHDSDVVMGEGEVAVSEPPPDKEIEHYNLGPGANALVLVGDRMPPARVTGTAPLSSDQQDRTREQKLEELRAEEEIVKVKLDSVFAMHRATCAAKVKTELEISRLEAR